MTVGRKLGLAFALHVTLLAALLAVHVRTVRYTVSAAHEVAAVSAQVVLATSRQGGLVAQLDETAAKYAVTRDRGYAVKFTQLHAAFDAELHAVGALALGDEERAALGDLDSAWRAVGAVPGQAARARLEDVRERLDVVTSASQATMRERLATSAAAAARAEALSWFAAALAILLAVGAAITLRRAITVPLRRLTAGTQAVAAGEFGHRLDAARHDEFGQVGAAFNSMAERLGILDRLKRDFVSSVSHDLKSPLASLRESTALLLDEVPGALAPPQRRVLELQRESAERLGGMIGKLLDLSRLEAGPPLALRSVALSPLLASVAAHATAAGHSRDVRVVVGELPGGACLMADEERLRTLLENLLENAIKFSPRGEIVELGAREAGDRIVICVADRGPGVPAADRGRIFERFAQTPGGRAIPARGVGLGLTICREIVQAHGGSVRVVPRQGGGSVFEASFLASAPVAALPVLVTAGAA